MRPEIRQSLRDYADHHIPTGGFLKKVLENNLKEAFGRADYGNQADMKDIVSYCYNEIPKICWGSPEAVANWLRPKEDGDA